jgi:hypothetical protein
MHLDDVPVERGAFRFVSLQIDAKWHAANAGEKAWRKAFDAPELLLGPHANFAGAGDYTVEMYAFGAGRCVGRHGLRFESRQQL